MESLAAFFAKPALKYGAITLLVVGLIVAGFVGYQAIYSKGEKAGAGEVKGAVQTETINRTEKARETKEKVDEEVRTTPYPDRVDGLR